MRGVGSVFKSLLSFLILYKISPSGVKGATAAPVQLSGSPESRKAVFLKELRLVQ